MDFITSRHGLVLIGFLGIGGYFLWQEHSAHVIQYLPWILLAACPLMHVFMHHGHGGHGKQDDSTSAAKSGERHDQSGQ